METVFVMVLVISVFLFVSLISDRALKRFSKDTVQAGESTFVCPDPKARRVVLELLKEYGLEAEVCQTRKTDPVREVDFVQKEFQTVNCAKGLVERISGLKAIGFGVEDPISRARYARHFLNMRGYRTIIDECKTTAGLFVFVISEAFEGWVLVFRDK